MYYTTTSLLTREAYIVWGVTFDPNHELPLPSSTLPPLQTQPFPEVMGHPVAPNFFNHLAAPNFFNHPLQLSYLVVLVMQPAPSLAHTGLSSHTNADSTAVASPPALSKAEHRAATNQGGKILKATRLGFASRYTQNAGIRIQEIYKGIPLCTEVKMFDKAYDEAVKTVCAGGPLLIEENKIYSANHYITIVQSLVHSATKATKIIRENFKTFYTADIACKEHAQGSSKWYNKVCRNMKKFLEQGFDFIYLKASFHIVSVGSRRSDSSTHQTPDSVIHFFQQISFLSSVESYFFNGEDAPGNTDPTLFETVTARAIT
jgi:hypothetical protein